MRVIAQSHPPSATDSPPVDFPATAEFDLLSDSDLLDAWNRDRHRGALATLIQRYSTLVLSVCRRRCRTYADADDAFQSTFLYLAKCSHKIRHPERLVGWLQRVAQRAALATLPSNDRESSPMVEPLAPSDDPLDRLAQRHEAIVLDEELADLPEKYRSAIVMHLCEGHSIQSLAEALDTTPGSVRGHLQRGKQLLARRLRRRGVIPALAYAAVHSWTVNESSAAEATQQLLDRIGDGTQLPDPPIETSLLESLLAQGVRLMPSLYSLVGVGCGTAIIAMMAMADGGNPASDNRQVTLSGSALTDAEPAVEVAMVPQTSESSPLGQAAMQGMGGVGGGETPAAGGGFGGGFFPPTSTWTKRTTVPEAETETADQARAALSAKVTLEIRGKLSDAPEQISAVAGVPVLLDTRGLAFAKLEPENAVTSVEVKEIPLRTALRMLLEPLGLEAVVEAEGLVITADTSALVHQGIGTTRWINLKQEAEAMIAAGLDSQTTLEFIELPLAEVAQQIQDQHEIPVAIDARALEEIGLSTDQPATFSAKGVTLRSALDRLLASVDLTYIVTGETLVITTIEAAEQNLATRIYWLESTGFAPGDFDPIIEALQSSVMPDTWEALGGPSTIVPLTSSRPAIMVSTMYPIHQTIDEFFHAMRESHFGVEPVLENVEEPISGAMGGIGGGGSPGGGGFF